MTVPQKVSNLDEDRLPAYYIGSVGRALTLLTLVNERSALSVSDAADFLDVAPSTAHRLLQVLVHHGYVAQNDRRVYVPGPVSRRLTHGGPASYERPAVSRMLEKLAATVQGTVHVVRLEGNGARFLAGADGVGDNGLATTRIGWLLPAHTTAGGRVILAGLPDAQLDSLYPDGLPLTRFCRINTVDQLRQQLEEVRRRGFATSRAAHENICGIGVAIPSDDGAPMEAITAAWPPHRFPAGDIAARVHDLRVVARQLAEADA